VFALYQPGNILEALSDGTYHVQLTDGDILENLPAHTIMTAPQMQRGRVEFDAWRSAGRKKAPSVSKQDDTFTKLKSRQRWVVKVAEGITAENMARMRSGWPEESILANFFTWQPLSSGETPFIEGATVMLSGFKSSTEWNDRRGRLGPREPDGSWSVELSDAGKTVLHNVESQFLRIEVASNVLPKSLVEHVYPTCTCCMKQWRGEPRMPTVIKHFCQSVQHWLRQHEATGARASPQIFAPRQLTQQSDAQHLARVKQA
jgi:hypothetical protein